ncbi:MAG: GIY-YIG nuclease family protein [Hyphomicrobiales bacterium]
MKIDRDTILREIKRTAEANGGIPLGIRLFKRETGIKEGAWRGIHWARWGDAISEAGYQPNRVPDRINEDRVIRNVVQVVRQLGRLPTQAELKLHRTKDPEFPSIATIKDRFRTMAALYGALYAYARKTPDLADIESACANFAVKDITTNQIPKLGHVYLLRWGDHYKIGKSSDLERRIKEVKIGLPERGVLEHSINTDDPDGIEAYWHRRFAARRANGEWFALTRADITAFKRRKFQ